MTDVPLGAPELSAIHPFGKMPVLRHGDVELFESKAIATYLDKVFPAPFVLPSDPKLLALTEQWVSLVNTLIDHTIIRTYLFAYVAPGTPDGSPNRAAIDKVMPALSLQVAVLDRAVAPTGYLVGDSFTLADINLMPLLHRLKIPPEGAARSPRRRTSAPTTRTMPSGRASSAPSRRRPRAGGMTLSSRAERRCRVIAGEGHEPHHDCGP